MTGRSRWLLAVACMAAACAAGRAAGQEAGVPDPREGFPCVYLDRTHEWLFAHDDLAMKMLLPRGVDVVFAECSLEAAGDLARFDVVVLWQGASQAPVLPAEESLLQAYVKGGGTLLLVGNDKVATRRLARAFGFGFAPAAARPLTAAKALVDKGSPREASTREIRWSLAPAKGVTVLVGDAEGRPVAAAVRFGKGRVVVWADDGAYWDFCAQRDPQGNVASTPVTQALFRWMLSDRAGNGKGRLSYVPAEIVEDFAGLKFRYSKPIAPEAKRLTALTPKVIEVVEKWNGQRVPSERPYTINFLSGGGGGWAGTEAAGVCVYGGD